MLHCKISLEIHELQKIGQINMIKQWEMREPLKVQSSRNDLPEAFHRIPVADCTHK